MGFTYIALREDKSHLFTIDSQQSQFLRYPNRKILTPTHEDVKYEYIQNKRALNKGQYGDL